MILLPLGHEGDSVSRLPWVTFSIIGLCVLAFLATAATGNSEDAIDEDVGAAVTYFVSHPYLEPDPELLHIAGIDLDEYAAEIEVFKEMIRPEPGADRAAEQTELDRLTELAFEALDSHPYRRFGLVPARASVLTLLTHMFLHGGWLHLLGNMLFLYLSGPFIEDAWGRPLFAGFYLVSGLAAAAAHMAFFPESAIPMIGASGAIAGVMGAFLIRYASTRIEFFYMLGFVYRGTFEAPAWLMLPLWFVQQLFFASMTVGMGDSGGVGYWAHVGGFAFGVAAALVIVRGGYEDMYLKPRVAALSESAVLSNPEIEAARAAQDHGSPEKAWSALAAAVERDPGNHDAALALWDLAVQQGWEQEAAPAMVRSIAGLMRSGESELAARHWCEVIGRVPAMAAEPGLLLRLADEFAERGWEAWKHDAARRVVVLAGRGAGPLQIVRAARIVGEQDAELAREALEGVIARPDLHGQERETAERALAELDRALA